MLSRNPDLAVTAVYPVPDTASGAGDQVMVAVEMVPGRAFDPAPSRIGWPHNPIWVPSGCPATSGSSASLPQTATGKVTKVGLRAEAWACDEPVWWRPLESSELRFVPLRDDDRAALAAGLAANGRPSVGVAH